MTRALFVWLHRWTGLLMAAFLIVVGITGSLLAFYGELNGLIAPELFSSERGGVMLDAAALANRAEAIVPGARANTVYFGYDAPIAEIGIEAKPGSPSLDFDYIYLDRHTGEERGRMMWGSWPTSRTTIMPFVYNLHYTLIAGDVGEWILGLVALLWTIDCFVGFYLTLPEPSGRARKGFLARWKPAWLIKRWGSFYRINFDLHRAGGLWLWVMLLIFAWSSVYWNLSGFYAQATRLLFDYEPPVRAQPVQPAGEESREPLDWKDAQATGERLMAEEARRRSFTIERPTALYHLRKRRLFEYRVRSSLDVGDKSGVTSVYFDAYSGELHSLKLPTGMHAGNTITTWLAELHKANVFGLPYKIFVCFLGLAITMLSVTGVYIWWKKRAARLAHVRRAVTQPAPAE